MQNRHVRRGLESGGDRAAAAIGNHHVEAGSEHAAARAAAAAEAAAGEASSRQLADPGADAGSATDPARNRVGDLYDPGATRPNRRRGGWFTKAQSLARAVLAGEFDEALELAEDRLLRIKY